jgi:hypothetical protein
MDKVALWDAVFGDTNLTDVRGLVLRFINDVRVMLPPGGR